MSVSIEMNLKQSDGNYEAIYPKTLGSLIEGKVSSATSADSATTANSATNATTSASCSGNSVTATKLATARSIRTNLASTSAVNFDGSAAITPGVTGILGVGNGGTGVSSVKEVVNWLKNNSYIDTTYGQEQYSYTGNGSSQQVIQMDKTITPVLTTVVPADINTPNCECITICQGAEFPAFQVVSTSSYSWYGLTDIAYYRGGGKVLVRGTFNTSGRQYTITASYLTITNP